MASPRNKKARRERFAGKRRDKERNGFEPSSSSGSRRGEFNRGGACSDFCLLPDTQPLFSVATAHVSFKNGAHDKKSEYRPYFIWGRYETSDGSLHALDCLKETARVPPQKHDNECFSISPSLNCSLGGPERRAFIATQNSMYFLNDAAVFKGSNDFTIPQAFLADLILRRATQIYHSSAQGPDVGKFIDGRRSGFVRHGFVFSAISRDDVRNHRFTPELSDAPFGQAPYTIPGYLSQDDIDQICLIAKHYGAYVREHKLPPIFPEIGQWGQWPEEFMRFVEPQDEFINLPWFGNRLYMVQGGFSCQLDLS